MTVDLSIVQITRCQTFLFFFSFLFPQECWWMHGWGGEFCSDQLFTYTLFQKILRIVCMENGQLYREITGLSVLNLLHIQLLSECIIWAIVLQIHFADMYQHNNQLCLRYNQTWLVPVKSSHFTYLHTDFLPTLSPNRPHKMQGMVHKFWSQIC